VTDASIGMFAIVAFIIVVPVAAWLGDKLNKEKDE
jgi:H+/gluconate symporter-like permease